MSSNSGDSSREGEERQQPAITDYITPKCPVCGRTDIEEDFDCHPPQITQFERRLATGKWLLSSKRPPNAARTDNLVLGDDQVVFECLYGALRSLLESSSEQFDEYIGETPYQIPSQQWIASVYYQHLKEAAELVLGLLTAIKPCEKRVEQRTGDVDPSDVFAHLVYLDQYGLIPGYQSLNRNGRLREFCAEYYDVAVSNLNSKWIVERRVDRSKVFSTTKDFRREWDLELSSNILSHAEYTFDGTPVLEDHRDHNLVTRQAKQDLLALPPVDWTVAPHIFFSRSDPETTEDSTENELTTIGFDFAGFESTPDGQKLRYLGIVTEHEEDPFEVYSQVVQIGKTNANGIVIMPNRPTIYDFLHFLRVTDRVSDPEPFPESREDYRSIPNVHSLHEDVVKRVSLLDGIALMPRRKVLDEGFQNIDKLINGTTYA